jgi:uncharacterized membrane protein (UPF0127 family)
MRDSAGVVGGVRGDGRQVIGRRFRELPTTRVLDRRVPVAATRTARLLGLALLDREAAGPGLLIPRCRCVHTFGMRFALRLVFLDESARPVSVRHRVPPRRLAFERGAWGVLEVPAEEVG